MTNETLLFLRQLLGSMSLAVGDPDFKTVAPKVAAALDELDEAIAAAKES